MIYDFCGYATRNNVKCSDGRIIMKDAFKDQDGMKVPLVWNHQHNSPENVLGHAILENRDDGVYAYAVFNDNDMGQRAKELVRHGDISALSIFANKLKEQAGRVMHGIIREVSLVLAGANPEAMIDSFVAHSDGSVTEDRTQGWFFSGMEGELYHAESEDKEDEEDDEEKKRMMRIEKMMARKNGSSEDEDDEDDSDEDGEEEEDSADESDDSDTEEKDGADEEKADESDGEDDEDEKEKLKHAESDDPDEGEETVGDIMETFTDKQKVVVMALIEDALESAGKETKENEEDSTMKHNVFDKETEQQENVLSHSDEMKIVEMAKDSSIGTLKGAMKAFCDNEELAHGFDSQSLTLMFPEYKDVKPGAPEMLTTDQGWITKVLNKVHKSPLTRVRTRYTDIRDIENIRAKGYTKGTQKALQGDISALYRTSDAQTVYVRSDLNRDDILDITDFDVVAYMYNIDRMMLNEELATAIMLGDGREAGAQYKIDETKIRNIWKDEELYTIHRLVNFETVRTELQGSGTGTYFGDNFVYAETFVQELLYGREDAKNVGTADLFITPHVLNKMLLARDRNGRRIYNTVEELRSALNVREIITAEQFEGKFRMVGTQKRELMAILVNLDNYYLGANKGGEITHFTDFDINFNKEQSLLETRCSGANTRPLSALVLECVATNPLNDLTVNVDIAEDFDLLGKVIGDLQSGITVGKSAIRGELKYVTGYTGFDGSHPELQKGNYIALKAECEDADSIVAELVGGDYGPVTLDEDGVIIFRVKNNRQSVKVTAKKTGYADVVKTFSLTGLKLDEA